MTMQKYLKITVSDLDYLIAASHVLTIERGSADTEVDILFDLIAHTADGAGDTLGIRITASSIADLAGNKQQVGSIVNALESVLQQSWTNPFMTLTTKFPITGVAQIQKQFA